MGEVKRCGTCGETKPTEAFNRNRARRDGRADQCRACTSQYIADNPEVIRARNLRYKFNIAPGEFERLFLSQAASCGVCGTTDSGKPGWCVDHDHACCPGRRSCGKCVRGVLCRRCNTAIGQFEDDPTKLEAAITYLRDWQAKKAA